jgi:hypothetical protein
MTKAKVYQLGQGLYCGLPAGPWQAVENSTTGFIDILDIEGQQIARVDREGLLAEQTARFIAQARTDLGCMVDEVLRCWEHITDLREEVDRLYTQAQAQMQAAAAAADTPEAGR